VPVRLPWQPSRRLKDYYHQKLMTTFQGRVAGGVGDLATWMIRYAAAYELAVGVALVPGSLNVVIDRPWVMQRPTVRLEAEEVGVGLGFVGCQVGGLSGWIVRTDKNNQGRGDHGLDVLEIVSSVHLRAALGLVDGDDVVIEVPPPPESRS
jgi:riboflavin kinase, archaea type